MGNKCQLMEQEIENLTKDKQELQEIFAEKSISRQKTKLDEMYDQLRTNTLKCSVSQPARNLFPRAQPDLFPGIPNIMDSSKHLRQGLVFTPETKGRREELWAPAPRQRRSNSDTFEISGVSAHTGAPPVDAKPRKLAGPVFGAGTNNPSLAMRNISCPQRTHPPLVAYQRPEHIGGFGEEPAQHGAAMAAQWRHCCPHSGSQGGRHCSNSSESRWRWLLSGPSKL